MSVFLNDPLERFLLRTVAHLPAAAQWSRRVGAEALSCRSLACLPGLP